LVFDAGGVFEVVVEAREGGTIGNGERGIDVGFGLVGSENNDAEADGEASMSDNGFLFVSS
jgi:hypothetical protein